MNILIFMLQRYGFFQKIASFKEKILKVRYYKGNREDITFRSRLYNHLIFNTYFIKVVFTLKNRK